MKNQALFAALLIAATAIAGCSTPSHHFQTQLEIGNGTQGGLPVMTTIDVDPTSRPADSLYTSNGAHHPDYYSALDQLVQWSHDSGKPIEATYSASFADFFIAKIDGKPGTPNAYWSMLVNGSQSEVGVGQVRLHGSERVSWTLQQFETPPNAPTTTTTTSSAPNSKLAVEAPTMLWTQGESIQVNGTVSGPARLTFLPSGLHLQSQQVNGGWSVKVPLTPGRTNLRVVASDDKTVAAQNVTLVRLVPVTVKIDYKMAPGHTARNDMVWMDLGDFASAASYDGKDLSHPLFETVHDAMVVWSNQTQVKVSYEYSKGLGFSVAQIDGVGSPLSGAPVQPWCYNFDGASASKGISTQPIASGDVIEWKLGCV